MEERMGLNKSEAKRVTLDGQKKCPLFIFLMSESINEHCAHRWISQRNCQEVNCIFCGCYT